MIRDKVLQSVDPHGHPHTEIWTSTLFGNMEIHVFIGNKITAMTLYPHHLRTNKY